MIVLLDSPGEVFGLPQLSEMVTDTSLIPIKNGGSHNIRFTQEGALDPDDIEAVRTYVKYLHVIGYVVYLDDNKTVRRMGFFRCYDVERRRFRVIDDPDYEYSD